MTVSASVRGGFADLHVAVSDSGIGIATDRLDAPLRAVRAGRRLDDAALRRHGPRARHLAAPRRADGRPPVGRVRPRAGLDVPRHADAARGPPPCPPEPRPFGQGATLLVLDDSSAAAAALADLAREAGFTVHTEATVEGALAYLDGGGPAALAVVDHDLGGVPGLEAVRRLRAHAAFAGRPVALASPVGASARASREVDAVVPRPARAVPFQAVLRQFVRGGASPPTRRRARRPRPPGRCAYCSPRTTPSTSASRSACCATSASPPTSSRPAARPSRPSRAAATTSC